MESWVHIRLPDDQAIRRPADRPFCHGKQVEGGEWYDDRYLADQYLRKERQSRVHAAWPEELDPRDTATAWERHYAEAPEARIGVGTGPDHQRGAG